MFERNDTSHLEDVDNGTHQDETEERCEHCGRLFFHMTTCPHFYHTTNHVHEELDEYGYCRSCDVRVMTHFKGFPLPNRPPREIPLEEFEKRYMDS